MKETILENAELFFSRRKEDQQKRVQNRLRLEETIQQLIVKTPEISKQSVDKYFSQDSFTDSILDTRKSLHGIRITINQFPPRKRFFVCETIDFFHSPAYIGKVLPSLINIEETACKYRLLHFVYATFSRLNSNIETIVSNPELFSKESLHVERGGLYSLSTDIARSISHLFTDDFLSNYSESTSEIDRISKILRSYRMKAGTGTTAAEQRLVDNIVGDVDQLRKTILDYISLIQTHNLLYLYAQKRHTYYKQFLKSVIAKTKALEPHVSSTVLAGCLVTNPQVTPNPSLMTAMISKNHFKSRSTMEEYADFIDLLTPSTVFNLIGDYKQAVRSVITGNGEEKAEQNTGRLEKSKIKLNSVKEKIQKRFKT